MELRKPYKQKWLKSLRFVFSYEGQTIQLISKINIYKVPPPSDSINYTAGKMTGFWYELRDENQNILYRRAIRNPIATEAEVFSTDPKYPLSRQKITHPGGAFFLLAPDIPESSSLVLFSSPLDREKSHMPAEELIRFSLTQRSEYPKDLT